MNPHQKNKIDINSLSNDEQRLFRLYGKLPNKKDLLQNKLKERKYFDSGDYALSKAGKAGDTGVTTIGTEHPRAEEIPHSMHPLTNTLSRTDSISSASPPSNSPAAAGFGEGGGLPGVQNMSRSPIKEQSHLAKSASAIDEQMEDDVATAQKNVNPEQSDGVADRQGIVSPPPKVEGIPIRR